MNQLTQTGQEIVAFPKWTADDFETQKPYAWVYGQKLSRFDQRQKLNALFKYGTSLGVSKLTMKQYWNDFLEDQKPAQSIGSNFVTEFPGQEKYLGNDKTLSSGRYICDMTGVAYPDVSGVWIQVISHPLMLVTRIVDVETNVEQFKLAWCRIRHDDDGVVTAHWKDMVTSRDIISSAQKILALSRNGIAVNSENAKEVIKYLEVLDNLNYSVLDTQYSCSHMGWLPDGRFSPYAQGVVFGGESDEFNRLYSGFREKGSEEVWLDTVKKVRAGKSVPARIALAASFAAPLVSKLNALSFFVHLWGLQGSGKTVALLLAASVWCDPEVGRYIKSFSGTKVSQELFAAFCGNLPVLLDELQVLADRKTFDDIIYALCEGVSKGRGAKDGGLQASKRWATVFLTTGEMPIVQSNSGGGAAVRTIEVNYGGEPFFENARETAETLKRNYGFAGKKFIQALQDESTMQKVTEAQKRFYEQLSGKIQDKQVLSASVLLAADMLAEEVIFHDGKALTVADIKPYLITTEQADINQRCYQYLVGWIAGNQKRFSKDPEENGGEPWGLSEKESSGKTLVYIIRGNFEKALRDSGFSPGAFLSWAKRNKLLKTQREDSNTIQKTIGAMRPVCVAVYLPDDDGYIEVDEPLPFE